jgi:hypothetical protein
MFLRRTNFIDYGDNVSGWRACWQRLSPFVINKIYTPSILLVMIRTLEYTGVSYKGSRLKYADLYMHPETLKFKRSDFDRASEILDAGYQCARDNLLKWAIAAQQAGAEAGSCRHCSRVQTGRERDSR